MYEKTYPSKRFNITLDFLKKHISINETIFDLGVPNPFSMLPPALKLTCAFNPPIISVKSIIEKNFILRSILGLTLKFHPSLLSAVHR